MTATGTPSSTERAREIARRLATKYDDPEVIRDLVELIRLVSDPHGNQDIHEAARESVRVAFSYSPEAAQALEKYLGLDKKEEAETTVEDKTETHQM